MPRQLFSSLVLETDVTGVRSAAGKTALVHEPVMMPAEQHEVVEAGFPAVSPVPEVVAVDKATAGAARKAATAVPKP